MYDSLDRIKITTNNGRIPWRGKPPMVNYNLLGGAVRVGKSQGSFLSQNKKFSGREAGNHPHTIKRKSPIFELERWTQIYKKTYKDR